MTRTRTRHAWHEAGHATIAAMLGVPVVSVAIHDDGTGETRLAPLHPHVRSRADIEPRIVIAFAGPIAMARRLKWSPLAGVIGGGQGDMALVDELLAEAREGGWGNDKRYDEDRYYGEARTLVREHWSRIERVARTLLRERALAGHHVHALAGLAA